MRNTLSIQAAVMILAAGLGYFHSGAPAALAALYGGATALINTLLLAWRLYRGRRRPHADVHRHLRSFMLSTVERMLAVGAFLAAGLGALGLEPLPLIGGFIAGQLALIATGFHGETGNHV